MPTAPSPPATQPQFSPNVVVVWVLRSLAVSGLGVAVFLTGVHIAGGLKEARAKAPFCGALPFFDCDAVLNSEWATWFGVPVSVFGIAAYLLMVVGLMMRPREFLWTWLRVPAVSIAGAAAWFIYLQTVVLSRKFCMWCMIEHAIGLTLVILLLIYGPMVRSARRPRIVLPGLDPSEMPSTDDTPQLPAGPTVSASFIMGVIPVVILIAGQHLDTHTYVASNVVLVGTSTGAGKYDEAQDGEQPYLMKGGAVRLVPSKHPTLGRPNAPYVVVEAIDYTCPRCKRISDLIGPTRQLLGVDYSFVVLTVPMNHECNAYFAKEYDNKTDERHKHACELAELAHAVAAANAARFEDFHAWLFEHQEELYKNHELAQKKAVELVGDKALQAALTRIRPSSLVTRDVEIAEALNKEKGYAGLPMVFTPDAKFTALPEAADTFAQEIYLQFHPPPAAAK